LFNLKDSADKKIGTSYDFMQKTFTNLYAIKEIIKEEQGKQGLEEMQKK